jgi:serine/threonine protein kinase
MGRTFVHQDIKPQNIMVTRDKVVKVTDFGLVYVARDKAFEPVMIGDTIHSRFSVVNQKVSGTYFYLSPEQILQGSEKLKQLGILKEEPTVSSLELCSDLYAFGCVLYEMVTGRPPFYEWPLNLSHYFSQTLYEEPASINSGNKKFDKLIMRLLRKTHEEREYQSFAKLEEALQGIHARLTGERLKEERIEEIEAWELINRGASFDSLGQFERAIAEFDQALTLNPADAVIYNNRGLAYASLGQFERAMADFDQALTPNPWSTAAYLARGVAYFHLRQYERAIADHLRFIELTPPLYAQHITAAKKMISLLEKLIGRR